MGDIKLLIQFEPGDEVANVVTGKKYTVIQVAGNQVELKGPLLRAWFPVSIIKPTIKTVKGAKVL